MIKRKVDECEFVIHKAQKKTASQEDTNKKIENNVSILTNRIIAYCNYCRKLE